MRLPKYTFIFGVFVYLFVLSFSIPFSVFFYSLSLSVSLSRMLLMAVVVVVVACDVYSFCFVETVLDKPIYKIYVYHFEILFSMLLSRFNGNTLHWGYQKFNMRCWRVCVYVCVRVCVCTDRNRLYTPNGNVHLIKFFFLSCRFLPRYFFFSDNSRFGCVDLYCKWYTMDAGCAVALFREYLHRKVSILLETFPKRKIYTDSLCQQQNGMHWGVFRQNQSLPIW